MYKKLAYITIGAVFFLILVGGIVRATGSGMGCPDWPKCFGSWVPPTSIDQLPANYKEVFGAKLKGEVEFNAVRTWVEYVNRLVGVLIGFLIFITLFLAWKEYWKVNKSVVWYSFIAFILVGINGGLGARVVATELNPFMITLHMLLAIAVVCFLILALYSSYREEGYEMAMGVEKSSKFLLNILSILCLGQLILGTQIRELVDEASHAGLDRAEWIETLGGGYYVHVGLAILIVILTGIFYKGVKFKYDKAVNRFILAMCFSVYLEFIAGGILGLFNLPAAIQPLHLTIGTVIVSIQFVLILLFRERAK